MKWTVTKGQRCGCLTATANAEAEDYRDKVTASCDCGRSAEVAIHAFRMVTPMACRPCLRTMYHKSRKLLPGDIYLKSGGHGRFVWWIIDPLNHLAIPPQGRCYLGRWLAEALYQRELDESEIVLGVESGRVQVVEKNRKLTLRCVHCGKLHVVRRYRLEQYGKSPEDFCCPSCRCPKKRSARNEAVDSVA